MSQVDPTIVLDNRVFVINKQTGPTSFMVVDAFRRASGIRKVGHTGTLDPLAAGVLVLCTGKVTKGVEHFMNLPKEYDFDIHLGIATTTLDSEGETTSEVECPKIPLEEITAAANSFAGDYNLAPPMYSALKHNGRRLYEIAREGETAEVKPRKVTIYEVQVEKVALPVISMRVVCSRGTYVRSIARDFGEKLGLPAHISRLVRTRIGPFKIEDAYPSERLDRGEIAELKGIKPSQALDFIPAVVVDDASKQALLNGALPVERDVVKTIGQVDESNILRILDKSGELLAIGKRELGERKSFSLVDSYRLFVGNASQARQ